MSRPVVSSQLPDNSSKRLVGEKAKGKSRAFFIS